MVWHICCCGFFYGQGWAWAKGGTCTGMLNPSSGYRSEGFLVTGDNNNNLYAISSNYGDTLCLGSYKFLNTNYQAYGQIIIVK